LTVSRRSGAIGAPVRPGVSGSQRSRGFLQEVAQGDDRRAPRQVPEAPERGGRRCRRQGRRCRRQGRRCRRRGRRDARPPGRAQGLVSSLATCAAVRCQPTAPRFWRSFVAQEPRVGGRRGRRAAQEGRGGRRRAGVVVRMGRAVGSRGGTVHRVRPSATDGRGRSPSGGGRQLPEAFCAWRVRRHHVQVPRTGTRFAETPT
jgi:hypothetical protein